ncbi:MAG: orotate phosphoribosyltransferase [Candidatus Odinarchaeia archaeon]
MKKWQIELIELLIKKKGLLFGKFKLKSGRISPYFFNLANVISDGEGLSKISEAYSYALKEFIGLENFDYIYGPAYKGIPLAASIAQTLYNEWRINKRWGYNRKEIKPYGVDVEKWLVGQLKDHDRIIIVDDVATTGETKIEAMNKLKTYSGKKDLAFTGILIMLDRKEKSPTGVYSIDYLKNFGLPVYSILDAPSIFEYLRVNKIEGKKIISDEQYKQFKQYYERYGVLS